MQIRTTFSSSRYEKKKEVRNKISLPYSNLTIQYHGPTDQCIVSALLCPGEGYSYATSDHETSDVTCMVKTLSCYFVTTRIIPQKVRKNCYPRNSNPKPKRTMIWRTHRYCGVFFFIRVRNERWLLGTQKVTVI